MKILGMIKNNTASKFPLLTVRPRTMTFAEYQLLTPEQKQGEIIISDYPVPDESDKVEVIADGVKTYGQLLNELYTSIDHGKITCNSKIQDDLFVYNISRYPSNALTFTATKRESEFAYKIIVFQLSSSSTVDEYRNHTTAGMTATSYTDTVPTSGTKITLYYNSTKTLDLGTLAENCMLSDGQTNVEESLATKLSQSDLASISIKGNTNNTGSKISKWTYFYKDDVLVKAIADIANGATLTLNTNYGVVTAGALNDILLCTDYTIPSQTYTYLSYTNVENLKTFFGLPENAKIINIVVLGSNGGFICAGLNDQESINYLRFRILNVSGLDKTQELPIRIWYALI